jgi:murein DD-endopeptidase MepM/ murein hydrolase activator NlpD
MGRSGVFWTSLSIGIPLALAWLGTAGAAAGELTLEGNFVQGGLVQGKVTPGSRVEVDGEPVRVSPEGYFLVGFGRDDPQLSRVRVSYPDGGIETRDLQVARREYDIQRIDGLPPSKVTPPKQDLERIRRESAMVAQARKRDDPRTDFLGGFIWPAQGRISGVYGSQRILNGEPRRPHFGVDVAGPVGTPVVAPADGLVSLAHPDMFFSGGTLVIDHGHRLSSSFLHLSRILVKEGQRVRQGEPIAEIGATGRVTGAHLDWRMNLRDHRIDPQLLAGPMPALPDAALERPVPGGQGSGS